MKTIGACFCCIAVFVAGFPMHARAQGADSDTAQQAATLVKLTREWVDGKLSTPGISVKTRQFTNRIESGELLVQYSVTLKGAPKDQAYTFLSWPLNEAHPIEQARGLALSSEGLVTCGTLALDKCGLIEKKGKFESMDFTFYPAKGEIFRLALVTSDEKTKIFFAVIPAPILKKDKSCSLEVVRLMPRFEVAMIQAKGFQPNEELQFTSNPSGELIEKQTKADANGEFVSALLPFVKGKQNGKTNVTLKGASCAPTVSFEWGK